MLISAKLSFGLGRAWQKKGVEPPDKEQRTCGITLTFQTKFQYQMQILLSNSCSSKYPSLSHAYFFLVQLLVSEKETGYFEVTSNICSYIAYSQYIFSWSQDQLINLSKQARQIVGIILELVGSGCYPSGTGHLYRLVIQTRSSWWIRMLCCSHG